MSPGAAEDFAFAVESQLRDFIAQTLRTIQVNNRRLSLFADANGQKGVEYSTPVGIINILAVDDQGDLVVFELKLDRGPDRTIGQLCRCMGWLAKRMSDGRHVHGVIVAKEGDEKLRYAASIIPNITLFEYET